MKLTPKQRVIGVWALVAVIVLINLYSLAQYPLPHCDEAVYADVSNNFLHTGLFGADILGTLAGVDKNHVASGRVFHIGQAAAIGLLGYSLWAVRFFSVLGWLAAAAFVFLIGRRLSGPGVGVASALLYLTSLNTLYTSHNGRGESWLIAASMGLAWYYLRIRDDPSMGQMVILGLLAPVVAIGFHANGLWFALALGVIALADHYRTWQGWLKLIAAGVAAFFGGALLFYLTLLPNTSDALYQILYHSGSPVHGSLVGRLITAPGWFVDGFVTNLNWSVSLFSLYALASIAFLLWTRSKKMRFALAFGGLFILFFVIGPGHRINQYFALWDAPLALLIGEAIVSAGALLAGRLERRVPAASPPLVAFLLALPLLAINLAAWAYLSIKFHPRDYDRYISRIQEYIPPGTSVLGDDILTFGFYGRNPFVSDWALDYGHIFQPELTLDATLVHQYLDDHQVDYVVVDGNKTCSTVITPQDEIYTGAVADWCEEVGRVDDPWFGAYAPYIQGHPTIVYHCGGEAAPPPGEANQPAPAVTPTAPTALPTQEITSAAPQPSPTPGPPPATLPPDVTPTAHVPAVIHLFHVSPFQALRPGDTVTVVWEYEGNDGMICQVPETGPTDCAEVPLTGERQFTVLDTGKPYWLVLYVNVADFPNAELIQIANLYLGCEHEWFFDQPEVALCPQTAPQTGLIAAQPFEHGAMLWVERAEMYLGLLDVGAGGGDLLRAADPLNIQRDTTGQVSAPPGLYAPTSGFGLVWRGDAEVYPDWRAALGWGLEPEFSYQGTYQCDDAVTRWRFCYVTHYDGWLAVLHPNGYWYPKSVTFLNQ